MFESTKKLFFYLLAIGICAFIVACGGDECGADGADPAECDGGVLPSGGGDTGVGGAGGSGGAGDGGGVGGAGGGAGGGEGGSDGPMYVMITDETDSANTNMAGTPGIDVCGIIVSNCDVSLSVSNFSEGSGDVNANRADPEAANDDASSCEADSDPSDYTSFGVGGSMTLKADGSLSGCTVEVIEFVGQDPEPYTLSICNDAAGDDCPNSKESGSDGGNVAVSVE